MTRGVPVKVFLSMRSSVRFPSAVNMSKELQCGARHSSNCIEKHSETRTTKCVTHDRECWTSTRLRRKWPDEKVFAKRTFTNVMAFPRVRNMNENESDECHVGWFKALQRIFQHAFVLSLLKKCFFEALAQCSLRKYTK